MDGGLGTALLLSGVVQGVSTGAGLYASRKQAKLDKARVNYESSQAELAAADAAYENTKSYRRALGTQIAMGSIRGAPGSSTLAQVTLDTFANYTRDQAAISRRGDQAVIAGGIGRASVRSERMNRDIGLIGNYAGGIFNSINFNSIGSSLGKAPGASSLSLNNKAKGR